MSFIKFGYYAFFHGEAKQTVSGRELNVGQQVAMATVAILCVYYGFAHGALFSLLPGGDSLDYTVFTQGHLIEGFGLAIIGLIAFAVVKRPLERIGGAFPDFDFIYNRLSFFGTRSLVVAVTELYAAVDRAIVRTTQTVIWIFRNPVPAVSTTAPWLLPDRTLANGDEELHPELQANIGQATFLIVAVLLGLLFVLFLTVA
jgi:multicomponent Na+:H+ antiporter subunit D